MTIKNKKKGNEDFQFRGRNGQGWKESKLNIGKENCTFVRNVVLFLMEQSS